MRFFLHFFVPESRDTCFFFAAKTEHNWMVNKFTRNFSFRVYFKSHAAYYGSSFIKIIVQWLSFTIKH